MSRCKFKISVILPIILLVILVSCSKHLTKFDANRDVVLYPPPPDTARIQYLTSISNSVQITGQRSGFSRFILGDLPSLDIKKPYGVAIHGTRIYICDTGLGGLEVIDLDSKKFEYFVPAGKGKLSLPLNCCVDDEGNLYVADGNRKQIVVFDREGNYLDAFGEPDNFKPTDVSVHQNRIYVNNLDNNQVIVYNTGSHSRLFAFPSSEKGDEDFLYSPTNLFVNSDGVYVSDIGDSKVKRYTLDGIFVNSFGSYGKNIGQFVRVKGISVDRSSNIYAVDAGFENVQVFNGEGKILMFFGGPYHAPGDMWLPAKVAISYENLEYFERYTDPDYALEYLIYVTNQYGPDKLSVYGFLKPAEGKIK